MLGGLLQNNGTNDIDQLPWLGDVPVLGALFRSTEYQKNETDLVILVTPHLVRPMAPTDPIHTPLDNTLAAERRRPVPDGQDRGQPGAGAARRRCAEPALCRPHPRSAEKWRRLCHGQRLSAPAHDRGGTRRRRLGSLARRLLGSLFDHRETIGLEQRRRGRRQRGHADGRSVAARTAATGTSPLTARRCRPRSSATAPAGSSRRSAPPHPTSKCRPRARRRRHRRRAREQSFRRAATATASQ